jgi:hypothetical protein
MIIVLVTTKELIQVTTKEKSLGTDFNQENWMLVIWLKKTYTIKESSGPQNPRVSIVLKTSKSTGCKK